MLRWNSRGGHEVKAVKSRDMAKRWAWYLGRGSHAEAKATQMETKA